MTWLLAHLIGGHLRLHPLRAIVSMAAIALGVALGYAVHLINHSALKEFSAAVRQASGQSDASVIGPREGFDEAALAALAADPAVEIASPTLELDIALAEPARLRGRTLAVTGIDALRAAWIAPHLLGEPQGAEDNRFALLDEGLFVSPAALSDLQLAPGDTIGVQVGGRIQRLTIAGRLPAARAGLHTATMDLGFAQWRFDRLGKLSRIELVLTPGADIEQLGARLRLPPGVYLQSADDAGTRVSNLSRAYRVNLNVLALVALATGAFLVYSLQAQSVLSRQATFAFLRVLGGTRRDVQALLLIEAGAFGVAGSAIGLLLGLGVAAAALDLLGGDLGGGYFAGVQPALAFDVWFAFAFAVLGVLASTFGGWLPARAAAREPPAVALRTAAIFETESPRLSRIAAAVALITAAVLLFAPPVAGISIGAYLAIALLLGAAILVKPMLAPALFAPLARALDRRADRASRAPFWLAATRLAGTPRFAAIGAAGIVASFALMVAMATMVASFRVSVDQWLARVLPADVYVRAGPVGNRADTAAFTMNDLQRMRAHPQIERAEFSHHVRLRLDAARAPVTLITRSIDRARPAQSLPLTGPALPWREGMPPPVWISEAIVDLYGARPGAEIMLPLAGREERFFVAGVWRDYARQFGALAIDSADYERITGDTARTQAALWLAPGASAPAVIEQLRAQLDTATAEFAEPSQLRALSLRIFDRSFAVTYVLELAAIIIGLAGIAATFSAQAIARTREFGMLRHLGVTRGQILAVLALEGGLVTLLAIALGLAAGLGVAWVLVEIVNPQSFHWTMDFNLPIGLVLLLIAALLGAAAATAAFAGRRAVSNSAVLAVREDW